MDLSEKIKFLRSNILGLSQLEFSRKINVTRLTVRNWEEGITRPTPDHIMSISLLCHVTPDYLIFDSEKYQLTSYGLSEEAYNVLKQLVDYFSSKNRGVTE